MRIQLAKETRQPPVGEKVQWPGVFAIVFDNFSEGIMISEHARIRILTLRLVYECAGNSQEWGKSGLRKKS